MINSEGLYQGDRVKVCEYTDGTVRYDVLLHNRQLIATLYDKTWANAVADVAEGFVPPGANFDTSMRCLHEGLLSLAGMRYLLAGILRRAAEKRLALSLEALSDHERDAYRKSAEVLRAQAEIMDGGT